jgi:prepilin-type processing-associated H-X9-DG protein
MDESELTQPTPDEPPLTFSLRTLFLVVTCIAIACAAFRFAGSEHGFFAAFAFIGIFLTFWFLVTRRLYAAARTFYVVIIVGLLAGFIDATSPRSHQPARRSVCSNNLRQIGIALQEYHQKYGSFPPAFVADSAGKPLYSWRVLILPFMDLQRLFAAFVPDQPWDGPTNAKLARATLAQYLCPSGTETPATTDYVAVVGPNTAWPGAKGSKLSDFKDPSKTILIIEIENAGINWAEPRDLYIGQMAPGVNPKSGQGPSSNHRGGVNAVFADGHIEFIPDDIDPKELAEMFEINPRGDITKQ